MKKKKITLLYRSGAKVHIKADSFEISRQAGTEAVFEGWV